MWPHSLSLHSAASAIRRSPGGQHPELVAQPAARAPVVGDGDDGGDLVGDVAQRGERGGQAVAAAEGGDDRPGHSRPRSRCTTKVATRSVASRAATAWVIATERCLPPVQPMAMVA